MPLTCHWHAIDMPLTCHWHAIDMPLTCRWHAIDMPLTCHWHAIHMPFTCHSHAIHMPFTCHSHAIHMPLTCHSHTIACAHRKIFLGRGVKYFGTESTFYVFTLHLEATRISRGNRIDLWIFEMAFKSLVWRAICDQYFCPRLRLYISACMWCRWLYERCKDRKHLVKSLVVRNSIFRVSFTSFVRSFQTKFVQQLGIYMEHRNDAASNNIYDGREGPRL
jgi:hypothetical protein